MATTFGAIYMGSYDLSLKVFEISPKKGIKCIDFVRSRVELGKNVFAHEPIGADIVNRVCKVLNEYKKIMAGYKVDAYRAYTATALSKASNAIFVLDQIERTTGIAFEVLTNSEHRFLSYKNVAAKPEFPEFTKESAALVNVGGGELQITLFVDGRVLTTQHLVVGTMRMASYISSREFNTENYKSQIKEMINKELEVFKSQHYNSGIKTLIITGDFSLELMRRIEKNSDNISVSADKFLNYTDKLLKKSVAQIAENLNLSNENDLLLLPTLILYRQIVKELGASKIWMPGVDVSDGIAYSFCLDEKYLKPVHDYDADVISAARTLSERYLSYSPHIDALIETSNLIFDTMKKTHSLDGRDKLLLTVAAILHDCGKFVSVAAAADMAYEIIMASEILGLSHKERVMVACIVKYNTFTMDEYEETADLLDPESYVKVSKLAAILRVSNALDRSHRQKFKKIKAQIEDGELIITVDTDTQMNLEKSIFASKAKMFEAVFSVKPVIKERLTIINRG